MRQANRSVGSRVATIVLGLGLLTLTADALAHHQIGHSGGPPNAPEIDPAMARGAITLLAGGVLILLDRRRRS
jgi:hypothetical protein